MSSRRSPDPVARVVAWHNRHPLAVRIGVLQVRGQGWVSLPFAAQALSAGAAPASEGTAAGASLRERALARARGDEPAAAATAPDAFSGPIQPAFSEDLLPPLKPAAIARFAQARGLRASLTPAQRPRREAFVDRDRVPAGSGLAWLHLRTAAIEVGDRRVRVLVAGDAEAVLGPRLYSRPRMALLALVPIVALAGLAVAMGWIGRPQDPMARMALGARPIATRAASAPTPVAPAASAPAPASVPPTPVAQRSDPLMPSAGAHANAQAEAHASAAAASATPQPPPPLAPPVPPPPATETPSFVKPRLDPDTARVARRESAALRAASAAAAADVAATTTTPPLQAPPSPPAPPRAAVVSRTPPPPLSSPSGAAPALAGPVFALVARTTKSRAASEILLGGLAPESGRGSGAPRAEVLASDGGYRASLWPFSSRAQAERVQQRLRAGGLETDLVEF